MQAHRSVVSNFLALGSGETVSRLIAFGATIYIARVLGADGYGVIAFAVGINLYFSKIADFAIESAGAKQIASHRQSLETLAAAIMGARIALILFLTALSVLAIQLMAPEPERSVLSLYLLTMIPIAASTKWIHIGLEDTRPVGVARVLGETLGLAVVLGVMLHSAELWAPPVAQIASETLIAFVLIMVLRRRGHVVRLSWNPGTALPVFRAALPLLVHSLLGLLIYNSDLIFLRMFRDSGQVGYYAAAYTLISLLSNLGIAYGMSLLPTLTRFGARTAEEGELYHTALAQVYAVCFPVTIGGCLLAENIIGLAFGQQYSDSVLVLQVLIWSIPMSILRYVPWAALIARDRQHQLMVVNMYAVLLNILLNLALIPFYGVIGAAIATVITECMVGALLLGHARVQGLAFVALRRLWRPTVAGLLMGLVLVATHGTNLPAALATGIAVYGVVLAILGGIRFEKGRLPVLNV